MQRRRAARTPSFECAPSAVRAALCAPLTRACGAARPHPTTACVRHTHAQAPPAGGKPDDTKENAAAERATAGTPSAAG
jgi:hypothetical protein